MTRPSRSSLRFEPLEARDTPAAVGALDPSFATAGQATLAGVPIADIALQPDGKVVAVGTQGGDFLVARFNADGTPDTSFNLTGQRQVDIGGVDDARAVAVQADGKIVVAGRTAPDAVSPGNFALLRLNADGTTDTSFDTDGRLTIDVGGDDGATAIVIQGNGKIVVAGTNGADFALARVNPADGSLDNSFDLDGRLAIDMGGAADVAHAVAVQGDGKIVAAGTTGADFALARVNPTDGTLDNTFDGDGKRILDAGGGADTANGVAVQPDGKIVVVGGNGVDMIAYRLLPTDGSLDNSFGAGGKAMVNVSGVDEARAVALQPDGKIVVAGRTAPDAASPGDVAVARLTFAGGLDTAFGTAGAATFDSGGADVGIAVALTPAGRLVVGAGLGADGGLLRVIGSVEKGLTLVASGPTDGSARVYAPNEATGQYNTSPAAALSPFGSFAGPVRETVADVDGDGIQDTIFVTGPGTRIGFAVISGKDNTTVLVSPTSPFAGSEGFTGGGFVAAGDFDGDGRAEIVVTPDQGGGPRVTIFSLVNGSLVLRSNFLGIDDPNFRGGARPAVADINGDGIADLAVAAGFQGGPRTAVFDGKTLLNNPTRLLNDFFAFPGDDAVNLRNGAFIAAGDVDGDGFADLIFGGGPGGAPRVFILSGKLLALGDINAVYASSIANFFVAGNVNDRGGVRVAAVDADGDNKADVAVGSGEKAPTAVRVYLAKNFVDGSEPAGAQSFNPFGAALAGGVYVG